MYKEKYLKYKNKYLQLKQLIGGTPELNAECSRQIELAGAHSVCDKCKYVHNTEKKDPFTNTSTAECGLPTAMSSPGIADQKDNILFFNHPQNLENPNKILKYNPVTKIFDIVASRTMLINDREYKSIKSYSTNLAKGVLHIQMYPFNISTFCGEGNIVWVTKASKVGSTGLDSCMFVVIILNNGSKICIHHNVYDNGNLLYGAVAENVSNYKNISKILGNSEIGPGKFITSDKISAIYLCVKSEHDERDYPNLLKIYRALTKNIFILYGYSRYLVDNNNDIFGLKRPPF